MATGLVWHERYMWHDTGTPPRRSRPAAGSSPTCTPRIPLTKRRFKQPARRLRPARRSCAPIEPRMATVDGGLPASTSAATSTRHQGALATTTAATPAG